MRYFWLHLGGDISFEQHLDLKKYKGETGKAISLIDRIRFKLYVIVFYLYLKYVFFCLLTQRQHLLYLIKGGVG